MPHLKYVLPPLLLAWTTLAFRGVASRSGDDKQKKKKPQQRVKVDGAEGEQAVVFEQLCRRQKNGRRVGSGGSAGWVGVDTSGVQTPQR